MTRSVVLVVALENSQISNLWLSFAFPCPENESCASTNFTMRKLSSWPTKCCCNKTVYFSSNSDIFPSTSSPNQFEFLRRTQEKTTKTLTCFLDLELSAMKQKKKNNNNNHEALLKSLPKRCLSTFTCTSASLKVKLKKKIYEWIQERACLPAYLTPWRKC